jgi:lipopolysaccharide transport system ATP-binding protein
VGTGFHPELTGRENIYLNGAILGMRKEEIKRKYDEIVAFAEVEKFLDTPVKRYSSGMYVRLAFAVAAHLEPEILIVDEVLAVGDAEFQKKCLGKMGKVAQEGRTVIFVSHNMEAVRMLCSRCILLNKGNIVADSNVDSVMSSYRTLLRGINIDAETGIYNEANRRGYGFIRFTSVEILDTNGNKQFSFTTGESVRFKMSYRVLQEVQGLSVFIGVRSSMTREYVTSVHYSISAANLKPGTTGMIEIELPEINLLPGEYPLYIWIGGKGKFEHDVLDDLTAPLTIICQDGHEHEPSSGFFMLPSRLVANVINKNNPNN